MPSLLVVDDDRAVAQMLTDLLGDAGFDVATCRDGSQVMGVLEARSFDMLILDVLLPHVNGFTLMEQIRTHPVLRELPVLLLSGIYRSRNHRNEMMHRFGVLDYLDKPVVPDKVLSLVQRTLNWHSDAPTTPVRTDGADEPPTSTMVHRDNSKRRRPTATTTTAMSMPGHISRVSTAESTNEHLVDADAHRERALVESESRQRFHTSAFVLQGSVKRTPVAGLLGRLWHEGVSGALLLRHQKVKKIIYLRGGGAYSVKSNRVSECLGQLLVHERLISEEECRTSIEQMQQTGQRQGELLVQMRAITENNLTFALELQLETKLFDVFAWEQGEYRFNPSAPLPDSDVELPWHGPAVVVEGIRRTFSETRLRSLMIPILDVPLSLRHTEFHYGRLGFSDREVEALQQMKLPQTTRELIDSMTLDPPDTLRVLYSLIALQLLAPAG